MVRHKRTALQLHHPRAAGQARADWRVCARGLLHWATCSTTAAASASFAAITATPISIVQPAPSAAASEHRRPDGLLAHRRRRATIMPDAPGVHAGVHAENAATPESASRSANAAGAGRAQARPGRGRAAHDADVRVHGRRACYARLEHGREQRLRDLLEWLEAGRGGAAARLQAYVPPKVRRCLLRIRSALRPVPLVFVAHVPALQGSSLHRV